MILADNETRVDLLNNEAIAATIIKLLRDRPERPVTVGVHGDWGAGKSSVLEMIEAGFEGEKDVLCLKFNGWRFQGFEDAKIALIEGIVTGLVEKRPLLAKAGDAVKEVFRRIDWLKVAKKAGGLAFTTFTGIPTPDQIQTIVSMLEGFVEDPEKLATKENLGAALNGAKGLLKPPGETTNVPEEIAAFRKAFDDLLEKAGVEQLVVLIDDLDRCLPDTAIETLEAVRLFVFTSRTAFVVAADEAMIEYAVRKHFPELPDSTGPQTYARNYLEKLIQVPFRIPALGDTETRIYVTLLLVGATLGDDDPAFSKLIAVARQRLKRPWTSGALDAATVKTALGDKAPQTQNALTLSDQIGPILASGTKGNPRQIKRFLNALVLRQRIAEARGFGDDVKLPVLAKLMLAERFLPRLFDQIAVAAVAAPDGKCAILVNLESSDTEGAAGSAAVKPDKPTAVATSSAFGGPAGGTPLVPSWLGKAGGETTAPDAGDPSSAPTNGPGPTTPPAPPVRPPIPPPGMTTRFAAARNNFSRFAGSGGRDRASLGRAISHYVGTSSGGARAAAARMGSSRDAGGRLVSFLSDAVGRGVQEALRALNLGALAGRPIEEIFLGLADYVCPDGGTVDEGIAREAFIETIAELAAAGVTDLDGMSADQIQTVFELYATNAIEARLCNDIGAKIITLPRDIQEAGRVHAQLHDFIQRAVADALTAARDDAQTLTPDRVLSFVGRIYEQAFGILQIMGDGEAEAA